MFYGMLHNYLGCSRMFRITPEHSRMFWNVLDKIVVEFQWNALECFGLYKNVQEGETKRLSMFHNVPEHSTTFESVLWNVSQ